MFKKKCILKNEHFDHYHDISPDTQICFSNHLTYQATIEFPNKQIMSLKCDVEKSIVNPCYTNINMYLYYSNGRKLQVIISNFDYNKQSVQLELIEIKDSTLRNLGLGHIIFTSWLKILYEFSAQHQLPISTIKGFIARGGNFTPKYSKKLYRSFNHYSFSSSEQLLLNKKLFRLNELEYIVTPYPNSFISKLKRKLINLYTQKGVTLL